MFEKYTDTLYATAEGPGLINERVPQPTSTGLPAGTKVFSADDHISVGEDIWYKNFPASMRDKAPRVWFGGGVNDIGFEIGKSLRPQAWLDVVAPYEGIPGCSTKHLDQRMADMDASGIDKELTFPNGMLVLLHLPDYEVRELCFRIYNQHIAELQARAPGRFYGVGMMAWWDVAAARRTLDEAKSLGLRTVFLPMNPGVFPDGQQVDYTSDRMDLIYDEIEASGIPIAHHIGESPMRAACQYNATTIGFVNGTGGVFRELFGRYSLGGILDRHPSLQLGFFEGGINWVIPAIHDFELTYASYRSLQNWKMKHEVAYYWHNHMRASFMTDPLGLEMIDRLGADRVMWSMDYPHNESSWGYGHASVKQVVDMVGPERAKAIVETNVTNFLKL